MKGTTPTKAEREFWSRLAALGCIACRMDGFFTSLVSIHHIDGRTKPGAHMLVLPLCAGHHQDGTGTPGLIAVHPYKTRFEAKYGKQEVLLDTCILMLDGNGGGIAPAIGSGHGKAIGPVSPVPSRARARIWGNG